MSTLNITIICNNMKKYYVRSANESKKQSTVLFLHNFLLVLGSKNE